MDKRPIGVFDSGLGGLTAVRQLMDQLPGEDIIYFGDTSRVPYGGRSPETVLKYTRQDINFLLQFDIKAIVIACNTADTAAGARMQRDGIIREVNPRAQVRSVACPLLVPLVENFRTRPGDLVVEQVVREYLQPLKDWGCDTLVLGCTHYPLLWDVIGAFMGPEVMLVNSGKEAACQLAETLKRADMLSGAVSGGTCKFYVSDTTEGFSQMASAFLEKPVEELVGKIDIERY